MKHVAAFAFSGLALLFIKSVALADDAMMLRQFGLLGTFSRSCPDNGDGFKFEIPQTGYPTIGATYYLVRGQPPLTIKNVQLSSNRDVDISTDFQITTWRKTGDAIRIWNRVDRRTMQLDVKNGRVVSNGQETPTYRRCGPLGGTVAQNTLPSRIAPSSPSSAAKIV